MTVASRVSPFIQRQLTWPPQPVEKLATRLGLSLYEPDEKCKVARDMRLLRKALV